MTKAGEADEDGEWSFGQVLSLTTWVPIGIELLSVYHCEWLSGFLCSPNYRLFCLRSFICKDVDTEII